MPLLSTPRDRIRTQNDGSTEAPLNQGNQPKSAWEYYLEITGIKDYEREREWQDLLDVILVFAALFASFLSTFLIQTLSLLQPDPLDAIQDILLYQTLVMQNSTSGPYVAPKFSPPPYAVAVNALFFASLGIVLLAAFLCMLAKGWIRELDSNLRDISDLQRRAVIKKLREQSLVRWRFPEVIAILPSLIHISLVLFFIGLALYLLQIHKLPAFLTISIFGLGVLLYVLSVSIPVFDDFSPFRSSATHAFRILYGYPYFYLCSLIAYNDADPSFMALPQTIAEKIREQICRFLEVQYSLLEFEIRSPEPEPHSAKQLVWQTSYSILNELRYYSFETSAYAKNIRTSYCLQHDDLNIYQYYLWNFDWGYDISSPSMKEAQCSVYGACMDVHSPVPSQLKTIRASVKLLEQYPDPWFRLVTLVIRLRVDGNDRNMLKYDIESEGWYLLWKAELLQAISAIEKWSEGQWLFVLRAMLALSVEDWYGHPSPRSIRPLAPILVKLLQSRVDLDIHVQGEEIGFWLHTMKTLLEGRSIYKLNRRVRKTHAQQFTGYAAYPRDPNYIRRLFRLSQDHGLDPSLMRRCLVTILYILFSSSPSTQQGIRLINQYLDIIREKTNVMTWSIALMELPKMSPYYLGHVVPCLLSGAFPVPDHWGPSEILHGFDRELTTAGAQPTTSILNVIDRIFKDASPVTGAELQNAWLSLYDRNRTRSTFISTSPLAWSPDCAPIASARLDLYDRDTVEPELDLVISFLISGSVLIACRALRWYLRLKENTPIHGDTLYFVSFPVIFQKGLSTDENRRSWSLLVELIAKHWNGAPSEWRSHFVETFFGYKGLQVNDQSTKHASAPSVGVEDEKGDPDIRTQASAAQSDGLGWMEDVWMTVSRPRITPIKPQWFHRSGIMHAAYQQSPVPDDETSLPEPIAHAAPDWVSYAVPDKAPAEAPQAALPESIEKRLEDPAHGLLEVLATFLEVGTTSMLETLCDRLRNSCLLKDERLSHNADSLRRIEAMLNRNQEG